MIAAWAVPFILLCLPAAERQSQRRGILSTDPRKEDEAPTYLPREPLNRLIIIGFKLLGASYDDFSYVPYLTGIRYFLRDVQLQQTLGPTDHDVSQRKHSQAGSNK